MTAKNTETFAENIRRRDSYWVERVKIDFAEELGRLMERRTVNRAELAQRLGTSAAYITKALRGDTNFTIESMVKLVRALEGKLNVHVSATEDRVHWTDVITFSMPEQAQFGRGSESYFQMPDKVKFKTISNTGDAGNVASPLAA